MAEGIREERRRLIITMGANEAPANWEWEVARFVDNGDGTEEALTRKLIPATEEEAKKIVGDAAVEYKNGVDSHSENLKAVTEERDEYKVRAEKAEAALVNIRAALA